MEYLCPSKIQIDRFLSLFGAVAMFGAKTPTSCSPKLSYVDVSDLDDMCEANNFHVIIIFIVSRFRARDMWPRASEYLSPLPGS